MPGREDLRIIYGPEYTAERHLSRLRSRGLGLKPLLAQREFALGIEALERFVVHEPLDRVHECIFGVLALESEPVDPRPSEVEGSKSWRPGSGTAVALGRIPRRQWPTRI